MAYVKKADRPKQQSEAVDDDREALLEEIAELKREKAELASTQIDSPPDEAMDWLKAQNMELMKALGNIATRSNQAVDPGPLKSRKNLPAGYGKPFVLTQERKDEISDIFATYEGKGIEYKFDDKSGSITFRRKVKVRVYDKENEVWTREDAWKSESVNCSSSNATINKLIRFLLLV